ncbi:MAG: hypothetical protein DDT25_01301 [Chloroflexi bacterium]|nr:hypothetical protein [Chloroflexota bacterium]
MPASKDYPPLWWWLIFGVMPAQPSCPSLSGLWLTAARCSTPSGSITSFWQALTLNTFPCSSPSSRRLRGYSPTLRLPYLNLRAFSKSAPRPPRGPPYPPGEWRELEPRRSGRRGLPAQGYASPCSTPGWTSPIPTLWGGCGLTTPWIPNSPGDGSSLTGGAESSSAQSPMIPTGMALTARAPLWVVLPARRLSG